MQHLPLDIILHLLFLTALAGTTVTILRPRRKDDSADGFDGFKLMSVATWGENPVGKWTLEVRDDVSTANTAGDAKSDSSGGAEPITA